MHIALISPKGPLYRRRGGIFGKGLRYAPLTLTTLAALVPPELHANLTLLDEGIQDVDPCRIPADLVGVTVITGTARRAYELAAAFRARGTTVVLGGPHVTLAPEDAQAHADAVVVGYAEKTWPRLLQDFAAGRLRPRYLQGTDFSLGGFPRPRRDLLPRGRYLTSSVFEATRGCIHSCEFCVVPAAWGTTPYQKPVEEVVDDIRRHGTRRAIFVDLNLTADTCYASRLFEALIPLDLQWFGLATTLLAKDKALLGLAARSGCRGLLMGLESVDPRALRECKKGFNEPESYREVVEVLHRHRIALQACFVFGADTDTPEVFVRTARFAVEAGIDLPRFAIATPFPGTPLFHRLDREGRILTRNWDLYDGQHAVFAPSRMSPRQLEEGNSAAWRYAYSAGSIVRRLRATASPPLIGLFSNLGYRHYARNLDRFYHCDWPWAGKGRDREAAP